MSDKISILKQMFDSLSDEEKSDFLSYLKGSKDNEEPKTFKDLKSLITLFCLQQRNLLQSGKSFVNVL